MRQLPIQGETVLITGASSGIGREFAWLFARGGGRLVLTARNRAALEELADELTSRHQAEVHLIVADLSDPQGPLLVLDELRRLGLTVQILINNAGAGKVGPFAEISWPDDEAVLGLNIAALTRLIKELLPAMRRAGGGSILNVASTGSYQPGPLTAVYYATKAYVLSLTLALRRELAADGIRVSAFCPGATRTAFSERAGKRDQPGAMPAAVAAAIGYAGLRRGKAVIVPGFGNKLAVAMSRLLPASVTAELVYRLQRRVLRR
jgi:short-subunit dehydrogenase